MAGHSKWANIQHRKGAQDKKRGKLFTKVIREISVAAKMGGSDMDANPRLRLAVDKAKAVSMPKDNIERAIKKAAGEVDGANYEEVRYEGYGPGGAAVMVDCMTDNKNRTVAEVRHAFSKSGGNLGSDGSVAYLFNQVGLISVAKGADEDALMEAALEAGAEDIVSNSDGSMDVTTDPSEFVAVRTALEEGGFKVDQAAVTMQASTTAELNAKEANTIMNLLERLEDLDDVQEVYSNAEISDEILAKLAESE
ncbi:MAG: YebC/PmpR family DNA-binding transcriptional regulator [Gammaproteobacteria bacterium]